ncbi:MAG: hypothetical protein M3282_09145 [Gemmatimonadota bacterium]|nr:hypothetical protein [Gemmatimonadota bacterium]
MRVTPARILAPVASVLTLALAATAALPRGVRAQDPVVRDTATADSAQMYVLRTRDGSLFVGRLTRATVDSVYFVSAGGPITVPRSAVLELRQLGRGAMRAGVYWPPNPGNTRLFFAPTGRMLEKGEGYFSDTYLFFLNFVGGITSRVTFGGGFSIFPFDDFSENIFYLTPKVGLIQGASFNLAAGALIGFAGFGGFFDDSGDIGSFGIVYGVGTAGSPDASVSVGLGLGYGGGDFGENPILMFGGERRVSRRVSLLSENYLVAGVDDGLVLSYGLRFFGDRLSVDLAFINIPSEPIFPGVPYVAFAVKF